MRPPARTATVTALVALTVAGTATAHSDIDATLPRDGATLAGPPRAVTATYGEPLGAVREAHVVVGGRDLAGAARLAPGDGRTVVIPVDARRATPGAWRARWVVVGADGHALEGEIAFRVRAGAGAAQIRRVAASVLGAARALGSAAAAGR
jgi:methionine-rich copper-binding protein CopC